MIRAVLDTNVLASEFVEFATEARPPARILRHWRAQRFQLIVSEEILAELRKTFTAAYFRQKLTIIQVAAAHRLLEVEAESTFATIVVSGVATHPEDDLVFAVAVSAGVDYLVTGDRQLQRLGAYGGVAVLSPRAFLDVLEIPGGAL